MPVYLDLDCDFMYKPRTSGNVRHIQELDTAPGELLKNLRKAGLSWDGSSLALFTDHREAYFVWKELGLHGDTLVHVDAHSDTYDTFPCFLHCGNHLLRAIEGGMFSRVLWVIPDWLAETDDWIGLDLPFPNVRRRRGLVSVILGKAEIIAVPIRDLRIPNARVGLVTIATSPPFVPARALDSIRDLVGEMAGCARGVQVRPSIPSSLRDPCLRGYLNADFGLGEDRDIPLRDGTFRRNGWRSALGFLWVEHRVMAEKGAQAARPLDPVNPGFV